MRRIIILLLAAMPHLSHAAFSTDATKIANLQTSATSGQSATSSAQSTATNAATSATTLLAALNTTNANVATNTSRIRFPQYFNAFQTKSDGTAITLTATDQAMVWTGTNTTGSVAIAASDINTTWSTWNFKIRGRLSGNVALNTNVSLKLKANGTTIFTLTTGNLSLLSLTNQGFVSEISAVVATTGTSGSMDGTGFMLSAPLGTAGFVTPAKLTTAVNLASGVTFTVTGATTGLSIGNVTLTPELLTVNQERGNQ